jgi:large subunit ribosomal protein L18
MKTKTDNRARRARRIRRHITALSRERLTIHRTPRHIYAQIFDQHGDKVLASASTLDKDLRAELKNGGNIAAAKLIGQRIAERAKAAGVTKVAFDRAGYMYHGRVKALADAARENGLEF